MTFFDYVFYRVCKAYFRGKGTSPEATAAIIVALIQSVNIISIGMLIEIARHKKSILNNTFVIVLFLAFIMTNYIRYVYKEGHSYDAMKDKYMNEKKRATNGILVFLYIVISIGLVIGLAVYEGAQVW